MKFLVVLKKNFKISTSSIGGVFYSILFSYYFGMTQIEKQIVKMIEDEYGYPYMTYDKAEQTWTNEHFLFDIKTETIYTSDRVKLELGKKYGPKFIKNNYFNLISKWFKMNNKYDVKHVE